MRLDSQCFTPRARRKAVFAGGTNKSHGVGAKSLQELADWNLSATRVAELTTQAGHEMKAQQTARVEAFHQAEANRPLTVPRPPSPKAPANAPQVGVVEMDGGRIRTRDEHGQRGVTHPHWREFQAGCVVRLQSEESAEDPRPQVPRLFLNRPKVHKLVSQLHRQHSAPQDDADGDAHGESIGDMLAAEKLAENVADQVASPTAAPTSEKNVAARSA